MKIRFIKNIDELRKLIERAKQECPNSIWHRHLLGRLELLLNKRNK